MKPNLINSIFKWLIIIITSIIFLYAFSASYSSQNIDNLDYVIAIGIDLSENSENLQISFEFADISSFSEDNSSSDNSPIIDTIEANSVSSAINIINAYTGKQINLSHCKIIVFSKQLAENGIKSELTDLVNNPQIRPTANIIVSDENAKTYMENSVSSLETVLTKYYDIFPTSSKYTGYTSNIILSEFYENLITNSCGSVAILGKVNKDESIISGDRGTENLGLSVFNDDKLVGNLEVLETLCYSILKNEVSDFLVSVDNPFEEGESIDISVSSISSSEVNVDILDDYPTINIKLDLTATTSNGQSSLDFSNPETLEKINENLKNYLSTLITDYLYKTSKEFKTDINLFFKVARKNFQTISEFNDYNWQEKYEKAVFNVEINSNITSSLLIQNS